MGLDMYAINFREIKQIPNKDLIENRDMYDLYNADEFDNAALHSLFHLGCVKKVLAPAAFVYDDEPMWRAEDNSEAVVIDSPVNEYYAVQQDEIAYWRKAHILHQIIQEVVGKIENGVYYYITIDKWYKIAEKLTQYFAERIDDEDIEIDGIYDVNEKQEYLDYLLNKFPVEDCCYIVSF